MVMGKINYTAVCTMRSVMAKVDGIMDNLPTAEEAKLRLVSLVEEIDMEMKKEALLEAATPY